MEMWRKHRKILLLLVVTFCAAMVFHVWMDRWIATLHDCCFAFPHWAELFLDGLETTLVAMVVRFFPKTVGEEDVERRVHDAAVVIHQNSFATTLHMMRGLLVRVKHLKLGAVGCCKEQYILEQLTAMEEKLEHKLQLLEAISNPEDPESYYNITL